MLCLWWFVRLILELVLLTLFLLASGGKDNNIGQLDRLCQTQKDAEETRGQGIALQVACEAPGINDKPGLSFGCLKRRSLREGIA